MELIRAAKENDLNYLKQCIENESDVDVVNGRENTEHGYTALIWASELGLLDIVRYLVEEGNADLEVTDKLGCSCLYRAVQHNHSLVCKYLIEKSPPLIHQAEKHGRTPLWTASFNGFIEIVEVLLENGADVEKKGSQYDMTPLTAASQTGKIEVVQRLISVRGANINEKDNLGRTAFYMAAQYGHRQVVNYLHEKSARLIHEPDNEGRTALWIASFRGHEEVVDFLLKRGADVEQKESTYELTPLMAATQEGKLHIMKKLVEEGRAIINEKDTRDFTALDIVELSWAREQRTNMRQYLQTKSAIIDIFHQFIQKDHQVSGQTHRMHPDPWLINQINLIGYSPLQQAIIARNDKMTKTLIEAKADLNRMNQYDGGTALHMVCRRRMLSMATLLIEKGADVTIRNRNGHSGLTSFLWAFGMKIDVVEKIPKEIWIDHLRDDDNEYINETNLYMAVSANNEKITEILIELGVKLNLLDKVKEETALHLACREKFLGLAKMLIDAGADVTVQDKQGDTCLKCFVRAFGMNWNIVEKIPREIWVNHLKNDDNGYNLLWHACKNGHLEDVEFLVKSNPESLHRHAPDGTYPYFMAFIRDHHHITEWIRRHVGFAESFQETELPKRHRDSFMIQSTKQFPVFNDEISSKHDFKLPKMMSFNALDENVLGDLCPMRNVVFLGDHRNKKEDIKYLKELSIVDNCVEGCRKKADCLMVRDMIKVMQSIEIRMMKKMKELHPKFFLVGSIIEGTRIKAATELDIMFSCAGLEKYPLLLTENDPFTLRISNGENNPMSKWSLNGVLNYEEFHVFLLKSVYEIIQDEKRNIADLTEGRITLRRKRTNHHNCPKKTNHPYYSHCKNCIFNVTQTKSGACLILEWNSDELKRKELLTVDLIPILSVKGMDLNQMFNSVIRTLLRKKPTNWLRYIKGVVEKDRILPESYYQLWQPDPERPIPICMKLLHFGGENNFIIKPAPLLGVTSIFKESEPLKNCYIRMKYLKDILKVDLNSYFIKKVLLTDEMKAKAKKQSDFELFEACLNHPDLRHKFKPFFDKRKSSKGDRNRPKYKFSLSSSGCLIETNDK